MLTLTWISTDETVEATFKVNAKAEEEEILTVLEKVVHFVRSQNRSRDQGIQEVESFLASDLTALGAVSPGTPALPPVPARSFNDAPAGGAPVLGWAAMPTMAAQLPAAPASGEWEYIPADEL